jgi:hypothetical protein
MKKYLILTLVIFLVQNVWAQESEPPSYKANYLKLNLLSPIFNSLHAAYERVLSNDKSLQIGLLYQSKVDAFDANLTGGFGLDADLRFYLSNKKPAPYGFFVAPGLSYRYYRYDGIYFFDIDNPPTDEKGNINRISLGLVVGGQWIFKNKVTLDVWGGPGYAFGSNSNDRVRDLELSFPLNVNGGFNFRGGATLGFAF